MDIAALRTLIDTEPANAGRTDAEVLSWVREPVSASRDVPVQELAEAFINRQVDVDLVPIEAGEVGAATANEIVVARRIMLLLRATSAESINFVQAGMSSALTVLANSPRVPSVDDQWRNAVLARANASVPRYADAGLPQPALRHIERARAI